MTFAELLELDSISLEKLTDDELLNILGPCLVNCPPVDIKLVQDEENKIKLIKLEQKLKDKEAKKQQKLLDKAQNEILNPKPPKVSQRSTSAKSTSPVLTLEQKQAQLDQINKMIAQMQANLATTKQ